MNLSNKVSDLLLGALGSKEARNELITAVEDGANALSNIAAGTNITLDLTDGVLTINASGGGVNVPGTAGNIATLDGLGGLQDSGIDSSTIITTGANATLASVVIGSNTKLGGSFLSLSGVMAINISGSSVQLGRNNGSLGPPYDTVPTEVQIGWDHNGLGRNVEIDCYNNNIDLLPASGDGALRIGFYDAFENNACYIQGPTNISATYDIFLPDSQGVAGSIMINDGSGNMSWSGSGITLPTLGSTPANPPSGYSKLYFKTSDGKLYRLSSAGVETLIG